MEAHVLASSGSTFASARNEVVPDPQPPQRGSSWTIPVLLIGAFIAWKVLVTVVTDEDVVYLPRRRNPRRRKKW